MRSLILLMLAGLCGPALAHPGHGREGGGGFSLRHYLSEPEHVAGAVLVVALVGGLAGWLWRRRQAR